MDVYSAQRTFSPVEISGPSYNNVQRHIACGKAPFDHPLQRAGWIRGATCNQNAASTGRVPAVARDAEPVSKRRERRTQEQTGSRTAVDVGIADPLCVEPVIDDNIYIPARWAPQRSLCEQVTVVDIGDRKAPARQSAEEPLGHRVRVDENYITRVRQLQYPGGILTLEREGVPAHLHDLDARRGDERGRLWASDEECSAHPKRLSRSCDGQTPHQMPSSNPRTTVGSYPDSAQLAFLPLAAAYPASHSATSAFQSIGRISPIVRGFEMG